jgi:hypothetical protein
MKRCIIMKTLFLFILVIVTCFSSSKGLSQDLTVFEDSGVRLLYPGGVGIPYAVDVGDVNGDGYLDVGVGNHVFYDKIFINNGAMQFTEQLVGGWGNPQEALFADMDGDGDLDFLTGSASGVGNGHIVISVNDGTGTFAVGPYLRPQNPPPNWHVGAYAVADFTGDGLTDIVTDRFMYVNQGGLNFNEVATNVRVSDRPCSIAAADVDGDGDQDTVSDYVLWLNDGSGYFIEYGTVIPYPGAAYGLQGHKFADFNRDGTLDLVVFEHNPYISNTERQYILYNDGSGNFTHSSQQLPNQHTYGYAVGDFNNDGWPDLITAPGIQVYLNNRSGGMIGPVQTIIEVGSIEVAVGDINNDGLVDLVIPEYINNGWTHIWLNVMKKELIVTIDIKPGSDPNCFNLNGHGVIPVAILGSEYLDVANIDIETISFAGLSVRVRGNKGSLCSTEYSNEDGFMDLVCHFEDDPDNWTAGYDKADLTGELIDGTLIKGTDTICIVP